MTDANFFRNTRKAIVEFDAGLAERRSAWDAIETNDDVFACERRDRAALEKVQDAFYKDTAHINSLDHCRLVGIYFLRNAAVVGECSEREAKSLIASPSQN